MARGYGITEKYWKSLNEDQKLYWNIGSRAVAFILGFFVTKTGIKFFDYCASYITIFLPLLIIQSQRSYNGFSRRMRRLVIGTAVNMTAWGVVAVGVPVFAYAAFAAAVSTLQTTPMPFADTPHAEIKLAVIFAVMAFLMFYTAIKMYRDLQVEELIYHLPKRQIKRLLVRRELKVHNFPTFAVFELGAVGFGYLYCDLVAKLVGIFRTTLG